MPANLSWLSDDLAVGGDLSYRSDVAAEQVADIIDQGITQIIDMRYEANDADVWREVEGMAYLWLPTNDAEGHHIPFSLFDSAVQQARLVQERGGKTFVHCHMGINRGPSVAYAILLDRGMDVIEAYEHVRACRPEAYIAYATDALQAHVLRSRSPLLNGAQARLRQHIRQVWTQEELRRVQHILRANHARDLLEVRTR